MKEIREIRSNEHIQATQESRRVEGTGVVFNSESVDLGGFTEIISPTAISEETLRNSDILFLLDHNRERGVLARSKNGAGSLEVNVDESGVHYALDAPHTALGDEILEGLRRGDINKCSFAFTVSEDKWTKRDDGSILRTIEKIDRMFDISIVYDPAYEQTNVVNKRGLEDILKEQEQEQRSESDKEDENEKPAETESENEVNENSENEKPVEEKSECGKDEEENRSDDDEPETETENEKDDDEPEEEMNSEQRNLYVKENLNSNIRHMSKNKFSLVGTIRDIVNNRSLDDATLNVIKEGRNAANNAGIAANGQIVLPVELRAEGDAPATPVKPVNGLMATEAEIGQETVPTDLWDVMGALRDRLVLAQAGAQFITAQGNIEIPVYDGSSVFWESEIGEAQDGTGKFSKVTLSPKRMTAFVDISKQLINQSAASVESMIRQDLVDAIAEKLQKTILGNGTGDAVTPKGLFNNVVADTAAFDYQAAVDMEAALENNNVYADFKYIVSPSTKAAMRTIAVDKGSGRFLYENNEVLGIPAYSTCSVVNKGAILGDFRQLVIANFGALDITIDEVSRAAFGQIRLVVNFYVDYAVKRENALVKRILK